MRELEFRLRVRAAGNDRSRDARGERRAAGALPGQRKRLRQMLGERVLRVTVKPFPVLVPTAPVAPIATFPATNTSE